MFHHDLVIFCVYMSVVQYRQGHCVFDTISVAWNKRAEQLAILPQTGGSAFVRYSVHDNSSVSLWVICVSLCQSIKITTNKYIYRLSHSHSSKLLTSKVTLMNMGKYITYIHYGDITRTNQNTMKLYRKSSQYKREKLPDDVKREHILYVIIPILHMYSVKLVLLRSVMDNYCATLYQPIPSTRELPRLWSHPGG